MNTYVYWPILRRDVLWTEDKIIFLEISRKKKVYPVDKCNVYVDVVLSYVSFCFYFYCFFIENVRQKIADEG